jgi:hypothetical protein
LFTSGESECLFDENDFFFYGFVLWIAGKPFQAGLLRLKNQGGSLDNYAS